MKNVALASSCKKRKKKKSPQFVLKQWKCFLLVLHFSFSSPIITLLYAKCNFLFLFDVGVKYEQNRTETEFVIDSVHLSSHINCDEASERSGTEVIDRCLTVIISVFSVIQVNHFCFLESESEGFDSLNRHTESSRGRSQLYYHSGHFIQTCQPFNLLGKINTSTWKRKPSLEESLCMNTYFINCVLTHLYCVSECSQTVQVCLRPQALVSQTRSDLILFSPAEARVNVTCCRSSFHTPVAW